MDKTLFIQYMIIGFISALGWGIMNVKGETKTCCFQYSNGKKVIDLDPHSSSNLKSSMDFWGYPEKGLSPRGKEKETVQIITKDAFGDMSILKKQDNLSQWTSWLHLLKQNKLYRPGGSSEKNTRPFYIPERHEMLIPITSTTTTFTLTSTYTSYPFSLDSTWTCTSFISVTSTPSVVWFCTDPPGLSTETTTMTITTTLLTSMNTLWLYETLPSTSDSCLYEDLPSTSSSCLYKDLPSTSSSCLYKDLPSTSSSCLYEDLPSENALNATWSHHEEEAPKIICTPITEIFSFLSFTSIYLKPVEWVTMTLTPEPPKRYRNDHWNPYRRMSHTISNHYTGQPITIMTTHPSTYYISHSIKFVPEIKCMQEAIITPTKPIDHTTSFTICEVYTYDISCATSQEIQGASICVQYMPLSNERKI